MQFEAEVLMSRKERDSMKTIKKQGSNITFGIIVILLAIMPLLLTAGVLTGSSTILFLGKCMAFAIVAMGLDLIWGYT